MTSTCRESTRTERAWQLAQQTLAGAVVAAGCASAQAATATIAPSLAYEGSAGGSYNSSGFFSGSNGNTAGVALGSLSEGVKLSGQATGEHNGWRDNFGNTRAPQSTGVAMAWWGSANGLRGYEESENAPAYEGDRFALAYDFTIGNRLGGRGGTYNLRWGFLNEMPSSSNVLYANFQASGGVNGSFSALADLTVKGTGFSSNLGSGQGSQGYWAVVLIADIDYGESASGPLTLTVPNNSIDGGVNQVPAVTAVPEPGTWAQMLAGLLALAGLGAAGRRRH